MPEKRKLQETFEKISKKLESVNKTIGNIIPQAIVRETSTFGNSSHIVLSKALLNKKVGVIVLGDKEVQKHEKKN